MDIIIYIVVVIAIVFRLVIMKGSFILPTFYRNGNEMTFNLGSVFTIIVGLLAAFGMMYTFPDQFANPWVAFMTTYSAPQIADGIITFGTRNTMSVDDESEEGEV